MLPDLTDQFIADSYSGILHTSNVPVSPTVLTQVYDGLGNKTSIKIAAEGGGASISGSVSVDGSVSSTATVSATNMIIANNLSIAGFATLIDYLYPVGSVYINATDTNPATRFTGTSWSKIADGRFIVGVGTGIDANTIPKSFGFGNNAGVYSASIGASNIPSHFHYVANSDIPSFFGSDLTTNNVVSQGVIPGNVSTYNLRGTGSDASIGKTSTVGLGTPEPIETTPPSYGLYIWQRIA
jgi:hypothetical protein